MKEVNGINNNESISGIKSLEIGFLETVFTFTYLLLKPNESFKWYFLYLYVPSSSKTNIWIWRILLKKSFMIKSEQMGQLLVCIEQCFFKKKTILGFLHNLFLYSSKMWKINYYDKGNATCWRFPWT